MTDTTNEKPVPNKAATNRKPINGKRAQTRNKPRVISDPNQVAQLVMMQLDAVNTKKDELTLAVKGLADTTRQLARAYAQHARTIQVLQQRVKQQRVNKLEEQVGPK
jgi:methyl-accepting chemotaxis protein